LRPFVTKSILDANGGLVDYLAGQSFNDHGDPQTFDWTVAYEAGKLSANYSPARQLKVITSQLAMREKMSKVGNCTGLPTHLHST